MIEGTVFQNDKGEYLYYSRSTTHTGTHTRHAWVDRLQEATVFYSRAGLPQVAKKAKAIEVAEIPRQIILKEKA